MAGSRDVTSEFEMFTLRVRPVLAPVASPTALNAIAAIPRAVTAANPWAIRRIFSPYARPTTCTTLERLEQGTCAGPGTFVNGRSYDRRGPSACPPSASGPDVSPCAAGRRHSL